MIADADIFHQAADWLSATPSAEAALLSPAVARAVEAAADALSAGRTIDVDALAHAIGGPRVIAEAFSAFIEWRIAPPPAGALQ